MTESKLQTPKILDVDPRKKKVEEPIPYNEHGQRICGARKCSGGICQSKILYSNGRCKKHGGNALKGAAHPRYKDGRYSKYLPQNLKGAYDRAESDPDLLSLRGEVALLQALAENALHQMAGEFPPWQDAADLIRQLGPLEIGKPLDTDRQQIITDLRDLIEKGADKAQAWDRGRKELKDCIERKTYTSTAEHKRLHDQSLAWPVEQAMAFVTAFIEMAKAIVKPKNEGMYRELMMGTARLLPSRPVEREVIDVDVERPGSPTEEASLLKGESCGFDSHSGQSD